MYFDVSTDYSTNENILIDIPYTGTSYIFSYI